MIDRLVETQSGKIRGTRVGEVDRFLGIPYAAPPVAARRLQPPAPHVPWTGVLDCLEFSAIPHQPPGGALDPIGGTSGLRHDEDCLTLNVWTPACDDERRPVIVWFYGGSFMGGCGAAPWTRGAQLAERYGAVVVTCNYRVGVLGYLHLADTTDQFHDAGNLGLLDQIAVLRWVRDNISSFGGDPDRVTAAGESAGGVSAALMLIAPEARGLVSAVAVQSGGIHTVHTREEAGETTGLLLDELGLNAQSGHRLLDVPAEAILQAQARVFQQYAARHPFGFSARMTMPIQPVADGRALPVDLYGALRSGRSDVPLLFGSNLDEVRLTAPMLLPTGFDDSTLHEHAAAVFGPGATDALDVYRRAHPGLAPRDLWIAVENDRCVRIPALRMAEAHPGRSYSYLFSYASTAFDGALGAAHTLDIPFVFDNLDAPGVETMLGRIGEPARELAGVMAGAWTSLARSGVPRLDWPAYDRDTRKVFELGTRRQVLTDPQREERLLWEGLL